MMKKRIKIEGMSCEHCVGHVKEALQALQGTSSVEVNLAEKQAIVETTASNEDITNVIEEEGYDVISIDTLV